MQQEVGPAMRRGRKDLRGLPTVTIDGEKARDFDDAVSIEAIKGGYRLWVHIADVAHYVREGPFSTKRPTNAGPASIFRTGPSPCSRAALQRHLQPEPKVDRLTLTAEMDLSPTGELMRHDIYESVINSNERMTYTAVREIIVDKDRAQIKRYAPLLKEFELMEELMEILRPNGRNAEASTSTCRDRRSSSTSRKYGRHHQGRTEQGPPDRRGVHACRQRDRGRPSRRPGPPLIYRIHEGPAEEKVADLAEFLATLGITLSGGKKLKPAHLRKALSRAKGTTEEVLVNTVVLRTMKRARYSEENVGHFGLAASGMPTSPPLSAATPTSSCTGS